VGTCVQDPDWYVFGPAESVIFVRIRIVPSTSKKTGENIDFCSFVDIVIFKTDVNVR
jgi:hypothetical protein